MHHQVIGEKTAVLQGFGKWTLSGVCVVLGCLNKGVESQRRKVFFPPEPGSSPQCRGCDIQGEAERALLPQVPNQDWGHHLITGKEKIPHAKRP